MKWLCAVMLAVGSAWVLAREMTVVLVLPGEERAIESVFKDYLVKRGLAIRFESLRFSGKASDAPALVSQIRARQPDLIYTWGTPTTLAVAGRFDAPVIADIPIIFAEVADPVGAGIVRQCEPPGRNVTGVVHIAPLAVQINTLRAYRPFKRLAALVNPVEPNMVLVGEALTRLAQAQGFELTLETLPQTPSGEADIGGIDASLRRMVEAKADFLYIGPSTFLAFTHRDRVTQAALDARLPTFCATESIVRKARCLVGISSSATNLGRFVGFKAASILADGKAVASVPVETLTRFSLLINMPVAKALDLYPPLHLLNVAEVLGVPEAR